MAIDHLPALPAREQQNQHHHARKDGTGRSDCGRSVLISGIPIVKRDKHRDHVTAGVKPGVGQIANLGIAEHIDQPHHSGQRCHNETDTEQPKRCRRPEIVGCFLEAEIGYKGQNEADDGKRYQHRM